MGLSTLQPVHEPRHILTRGTALLEELGVVLISAAAGASESIISGFSKGIVGVLPFKTGDTIS